MIKRIFKWIMVLLVLSLISVTSYNYYYYYKSLRINKDIYKELKIVVDDFSESLELLEKNDIMSFLNNNYQMIKYSNYLKLKNHRMYNNMFVKINMLDGSLFSNEVSDGLLWFNDLNTKLNNFYTLNDELFNSDILITNPSKAMNDIKSAKSLITELNILLNAKNPRIVDMINDQKIDEKYFSNLEKKISLSYKFYEVIDSFMGGNKDTNILVLVQNTFNMNQSGGKWAYYLTLTCKKYVCKFSDIDFISSLTSAMVDKLIPPEEIRTKKTIWTFEDLGWFFNFEDTANLTSYYPTKDKFDVVMVVNISIFEKLMKNMGSVDFNVSEDKIVVDGNNVVDFLIKLTQYKNNKDLADNTEKLSAFWSDFSKTFEKNYVSVNNIKYFISNIYDFIENKKIQLYMETIKDLEDLKYNNSLHKIDNSDFLAISKSNILDKVYDQNVNFKVDLKVDIDDKYIVSNKALVTVNNTNSSKIRDQVISYFQFYVNKGSKLESMIFPSKMGASRNSTVDYEKHGFITDKKIDTINTKTAYLANDDVRVYEDGDFLITGGWVITSSNQNKKIEFDWKSNYVVNKDEKIYRLYIQKQANVDYLLNLEINYPSDINGKNTITKNINIDSDKLIEIKID